MNATAGARRPVVTFVCIHNAGRSQMAAGFARALGGDRIEVRSAGTSPDATISGTAVAAMAEVGIDITGQVPHLLTLEDAQPSELVITTGCGADCPVFPGIDYDDWTLPIQAGSGLEHVRPVRDAIRLRVERLLEELASEPANDAPAMPFAPTRELSRQVAATRLVVVGGSDAGASAALRARELDPRSEVTVVLARVDQISDLDLSYSPPLGSPWDAVQIAAQAWVRDHPRR